MPEKVVDVKRPSSGFSRWMFRAPIWLYRTGLGGLMTKRMVLLNHVGRKSGKMRQAVVEVAKYDKAADTVYVASGWGAKSDWYRNLLANPDIMIQRGWRKMAVTAVPLTPEQSGEAMVDYAHRYPMAAKVLSKRLLGYEVDGTDEDYYALGHDAVPFMALKPRS
ncbi:MAG: nitroreductase family deazaflavin-dependent oxidoreductase [Ardenticatenaceae bacterium]|nr:nitroreductase family deazaflavin-dependent oxidoreductase [Ardenticatenaceae bacterium]MCB9444496.1 nitroreductase family deazaflavin-dependent oxidoreductase [Ardenticatenaceae bacterium]